MARQAEMIDRMRSGRHAATLAVVLVLAVGAVLWLARATWTSDRNHRAATERVLRDYAAFAAWTYSYRLKSNMFASADPIFQGADGNAKTIDAVLGGMRSAGDSLSRCDCTPAHAAQFYFYADLNSGQIVIEPGTGPDGSYASIRTRAIAASAAEQFQGAKASRVPGAIPYQIVSARDGQTVWLAYYALRYRGPGDPGMIVGFEVELPQTGGVFGSSFHDTPLLPASLTRGLSNDSILAVSVTTQRGESIYRTQATYQSAFSATTPLAMGDSSVIVSATINPDVAERLVIGGLPPSRVVQLVLLTAVALLLLIVASMIALRASALARLRSDFTSSVSHELKTPLTQILLYSETLGLGRLTTKDEIHEAADVIARETRRLIQMVDNILHFSKVERQVVRVSPSLQPLAPIVDGALQAFRPLLERGVRVVASVDPALSANVDADALRHILFNLLDNALRYGPNGGAITISARRVADDVVISVDDEGPGVPSAERERIWRPFVTLQSIDGPTPGTGIGLGVVQELAEAMKGKAVVEDSPSGGARFSIWLPYSPHRVVQTQSSSRASAHVPSVAADRSR